MKSWFINALKNVAFYGANLMMLMVFKIFTIFKIKSNKIFVNVYDGRGLEDHPKYVINELLSINSDLEIIWFANHFDTEITQISFAKPWSIKAIYHMATARVWISTVRMPLYAAKRKNQIYIQLWHGTLPIKKVEADCESVLSPRYVHLAKKDSTRIDFFVSGSKFGTKNFETSFWYSGDVINMGSPRSDVLFDNRLRSKIREHLGISEEILVTYAPTFRKRHDVYQLNMDFEEVKLAIESRFQRKCVIGVRLHPMVAKKRNLLKLGTDILNLNLISDAQEVLAATDVLITDYSSIIFDFIETKRPAFIFVEDVDEYAHDRGLYFNLSELPFPIAYDNHGLQSNIREFNEAEYIDKLKSFIHLVGLENDGNSSVRVAHLINSFITQPELTKGDIDISKYLQVVSDVLQPDVDNAVSKFDSSLFTAGVETKTVKIGVLGAGTWGTALARMLSNTGNDVVIWSAIESEVEEYSRTRRHPNLPGMEIPDQINFTADIESACADKDIVLFAIPSVYVRSTVAKAAPYIDNNQIIVDVAKGIELDTLFTMTQIIAEELVKEDKHPQIVALSGPTHAEEVALDMPTTIVAACQNLGTAEKVQDVFMNTYMRVYTNQDVLGVELCGAMKNIIALAAGTASGLGYGDNIKAALITRGLAEITRLGVAMGCLEETFYGLAGVGDLIVTATSKHSRNNKAGYLIGTGMNPAQAVKEVGMVVEGINAIPAAMQLAAKYGVEMPIVEAVNAVVNEGADVKETVGALMQRDKKSELPKSALDLSFEHTVIKNRKGLGMKRVITYGTFDLLHYGHINLLKRAKALGDYLVVVLSSDEFNWNEKHKKCYFTYEQRKALLESIRYVDLVIPETNWEQKKTDVHEYHIDTFVMGDDWEGEFDFLKDEGVEVVYLPRTPEISTTQIKHDLNSKAARTSGGGV